MSEPIPRIGPAPMQAAGPTAINERNPAVTPSILPDAIPYRLAEPLPERPAAPRLTEGAWCMCTDPSARVCWRPVLEPQDMLLLDLIEYCWPGRKAGTMSQYFMRPRIIAN